LSHALSATTRLHSDATCGILLRLYRVYPSTSTLSRHSEMLRYVWHSHYPLSSETIKKDAIDIRSSAGAISTLSHAVDYRVQ